MTLTLSPELFYILVGFGMIAIFTMIYLLKLIPSNGWFVFSIIGALVIGWCVFAPTLDHGYNIQSANTESINYIVIDSLHELNWFVFNDYTVKLSNGDIIRVDNPYDWKSYKPGDTYSCTKTTWNSFVKGTVVEIDCGGRK